LDGYALDELEPAPVGLAHGVFFGVEAGSGFSVVVKIEQIPGRLDIEHQALLWLRQKEVDVPRVHWFGRGRVGDGSLARCLVTERIDGKPPQSPASWSRMGRTLQRLEGVPWRGSDLPVLDKTRFLLSHEQKVALLGDRISSFAMGEPTQSLVVRR
jgi:aminoglycoside phosphotransferase